MDVARLAGVSPATVSLVLNGRIGGNVRISEETRQRVLDAIQALGYVVNPVARSLAGGENRLLGVFTYEAIFPIQNQDFYYPFLIGIEEEAAALGYDLLLFTGRGEKDGRRTIFHDGVNRLAMADGAVLLGLEKDKHELIRLVQEGYPFVFVGRREVADVDLAYVAADYVEATATVLADIFDHGHRRVAYLGMPVDNESANDRLSGYHLAHERRQYVVDARFVHRLKIDAITPAFVQQHLDLGVSAFVAEHDSAVEALISAGDALGKRIPHDFSLAMLGDPLSGRKELAEITAFTIPRRQMGVHAVRLLLDILTGKSETKHVTLPCRFVAGSSVGRRD
ncbi:MAG: LacI family DNA-binding transcriptional regulator [Caldilineaceae bacterium]